MVQIDISFSAAHGCYCASTLTGPLRTKSTNQSVNWEQRMATLFVNEPMKLKNANNGLTTKIWNPTKLRRVADVSENFVTFWLVRFDPIFGNFFRLFNVSNGFGKLYDLDDFLHNGLCPLRSTREWGHTWCTIHDKNPWHTCMKSHVNTLTRYLGNNT